jgi:hypothetical protein
MPIVGRLHDTLAYFLAASLTPFESHLLGVEDSIAAKRAENHIYLSVLKVESVGCATYFCTASTSTRPLLKNESKLSFSTCKIVSQSRAEVSYHRYSLSRPTYFLGIEGTVVQLPTRKMPSSVLDIVSIGRVILWGRSLEMSHCSGRGPYSLVWSRPAERPTDIEFHLHLLGAERAGDAIVSARY